MPKDWMGNAKSVFVCNGASNHTDDERQVDDYYNIVGLFGTVILMGLAIGQVLCLAVSANRSAIHDLLAGTTVVDYASQRIFRTTEDLIAYKKMIHAEEVSRKKY